MVDAAFIGAGKVAGVEVWRIENMAPVKLSEFTGKLYSGDSYIFLHTIQSKRYYFIDNLLLKFIKHL